MLDGEQPLVGSFPHCEPAPYALGLASRQFLIGASPLASAPLRSRRLGSARHLPSRLASSASHLPSRPAGSACRLAGSFARRPRRLSRRHNFLQFYFDVAICPFSSAHSSNDASLFADLPSHMASQLLFYWNVEVKMLRLACRPACRALQLSVVGALERADRFLLYAAR